jgi:hypothetical protein
MKEPSRIPTVVSRSEQLSQILTSHSPANKCNRVTGTLEEARLRSVCHLAVVKILNKILPAEILKPNSQLLAPTTAILVSSGLLTSCGSRYCNSGIVRSTSQLLAPITATLACIVRSTSQMLAPTTATLACIVRSTSQMLAPTTATLVPSGLLPSCWLPLLQL